jgi:F-type H+-transporting ATPase subunit delta
MVDSTERRPDAAPQAPSTGRRPSRAASASARRYARALLDVALQSGDAGKLRTEIDAAAGVLFGSADLFAALTHPAIAPDKKKKIVASVWGTRGASPLFLRFVTLLAEKDRLALLPGIATAYAALWNAHQGTVTAEAVTAQPLDTIASRALQTALEKSTGRDVELTTRIDPQILGGVLVTMGGRTYDGTVAGRLVALRERLRGGSAGVATS